MSHFVFDFWSIHKYLQIAFHTTNCPLIIDDNLHAGPFSFGFGAGGAAAIFRLKSNTKWMILFTKLKTWQVHNYVFGNTWGDLMVWKNWLKLRSGKIGKRNEFLIMTTRVSYQSACSFSAVRNMMYPFSSVALPSGFSNDIGIWKDVFLWREDIKLATSAGSMRGRPAPSIRKIIAIVAKWTEKIMIYINIVPH